VISIYSMTLHSVLCHVHSRIVGRCSVYKSANSPLNLHTHLESSGEMPVSISHIGLRN
jgi:hypothetical protein